MVVVRALVTALILCVFISPTAHAGRISTYIEGTIIKKSSAVWVVQTRTGTYWISVVRPPSFTRKISEIETGFWVQLRDIKRFRPTEAHAAID
jgi:hypothetical protein